MRRRACAALLTLAAVLAACDASTTPSPTQTASPTPTQAVSPSPSSPTPQASPTPTPEPSLSLDLPETSDPRRVAVATEHTVAPDGGGQIVVTVTSEADERIDELVLRWPTELDETLFLAPFQVSDDRIREGGDPLVQPWTKWVVGPGERGEPAGTTSLGYGPLMPGATLEIPLFVARTAPGEVAFDLQVLAGNELLSLSDGEPAELRIEIP